jgi:hypothetical protein
MYVYLEILRVADEVLEVKSVLTKKNYRRESFVTREVLHVKNISLYVHFAQLSSFPL